MCVFLLLQCSGIGILVVGALALDDPNTLVNALMYIPQIEELSLVMDISAVALGPAIYLTCFGSLVIVLSIIGVGGAFKRSKPIIMIVRMISTTEHSMSFLNIHTI